MYELRYMPPAQKYFKKINYEVAYRIIEEGEQVVIIILAGTRENFYQELKRYMSI